jgi:hypothetical protein
VFLNRRIHRLVCKSRCTCSPRIKHSYGRAGLYLCFFRKRNVRTIQCSTRSIYCLMESPIATCREA